jgi:hypothetical protein
MDGERHFANFPRLRSLVEKFRDKSYRDSYVASHTRRFLAHQMRKFRGEMSQSQFADLIAKKQTVVSRLENPRYGKWTLQTLFDVASKLNVAVIVRFVDIPTFIKLSEDLSESASHPRPYDEAAADALVEPKKIVIRPPKPDESTPAFGVGNNDQLIEISNPKGNTEDQPLGIIRYDSGGQITLQ